MKNKLLKTGLGCILAIISVQFTACEKLAKVDAPPTSTNTDVVFNAEATSAAIMTGVYARMHASNMGISSLSFFTELMGDNLHLFDITDPVYLPFYRNALTPVAVQGAPTYWEDFFTVLYNINSVLEYVPASSSLSAAFKSRILGEAYFMRAFSYYYMVNLYGDVPLVTTTDYKASQQLARTPAADVYKQIIADLLEAQKLLGENYVDGSLLKKVDDRLRPNRYAATALLARVYLHTGAYANAEAQATDVINKITLYEIIPLNDVFKKNSKETIWALQSVRTGENTMDAIMYVLPAAGPNTGSNPVYLSNRLMSRFEANDQRKVSWTNSVTVGANPFPYAYKYKVSAFNSPVSEFNIVLRIAEQYLIRAEARMQQNNFDGASNDINVIRLRAGLTGISGTSKEALLPMILQERRMEFFTEWGHRWIDMKRLGKINEIMPPVAIEKEGTWKTEWQLMPVPQYQRTINTNLFQNPGYTQ